MRQYDTHLEKIRKSLPAVARLQAGRSSKASLQTNSQTPGSPLCGSGPSSPDDGAYRRPAVL